MNKDAGVNDARLLSNPVLFHELINRANDNLSIIDLPTGRYLYVNEMTCRSTGYTPEEFRKMTVADVDPTVTTSWNANEERRRRKKTRVFVREGMITMPTGKHEMGHTNQAQRLGPLYIPAWILSGGLSENNQLEKAADQYGRGQIR